ncbi:MAG: DEAD/DEAH box helicase [Gammaproteobacteria bacterium]
MKKKYRQLLSLLQISPDYLQDEFGAATVSRGIQCFESGKVIQLSEPEPLANSSKDIAVFGRVAGSRSEQYSTNMQILFEVFGEISVSSRCSCPVSFDCKHGIALLFSFLEGFRRLTGVASDGVFAGQPGTEKEVNDWLSYMQAVEQEVDFEPSIKSDGQPYHLVYVLNYTPPRFEKDRAGLFANYYKARVLKKGGYGKTHKIDAYEITEQEWHHHTNCFFNEQDTEIVAWLDGLPVSDSYSTARKYFLQGALGQLVLEKMLTTGRCFWKTLQSSALSNGGPRPVEMKWVEEGDICRPEITCNPSVNMMFTLEDIYYLDEALAQCGLVKHEMPQKDLLMAFANAPAIPKKMARKVSQKIIKALPSVDFPLPAKLNLKVIETEGEQPVCCLRLHAVPVASPGQKNKLMHIASLEFQYAGVRYQPKTPNDLIRSVTTVIKGKTRYKILRQTEAEKLAVNLLNNYGFCPANMNALGILDMNIPAQSIEESVLAWDAFRTTTVPELENDGWLIEVDDSFSLAIETVEDWCAELEDSQGGDWFEMKLGFEVNGQIVNLLPLLVELLAQNPDRLALQDSLSDKGFQILQIADYQWVKVPASRILQIIDTIIELYDSNVLTKDGTLEIAKVAALNFNELLNDPAMRWKGADELKRLNQQIRGFSGIEAATLPEGLQADLRDYQKHGLDWLQFLRIYEFNGILADDMGLGKTVQVLTNLLLEKEQGRANLPSLVIAPTSLMSNWKNEASKFTPDLKVLILQGANRKKNFSSIAEHDVVLTTYPLMVRDKTIYEEQEFHYLILDEAQAIKNVKAKSTQLIYALKARHRLCVTGTPMENHLGEIWSMFHFLMPGFLGSHERFNRLFRTPIEKNSDAGRGQQLRRRIEPFLLRRSKDVVASELPRKTEIIRSVPLSGKQRDLYETVRVAMDKKVRDEIKKKGLARSHIMILDALLKLRQVCCDPQLVKLEKARKVKESAKLDLLMDMLPEMVEEGRKILLFSQFTSMLAIIEKQLVARKISYSKLTGQTRKRAEAIASFQEGNAAVFLISLKAGGVGLNLTAADTIIHYDPWWNPAVEKQATDRAHRIGQDKPVFVYKLLIEESVEEKILDMQERKQMLADALYGGKDKQQAAVDQNDLMDLLKPLG